MDRRRTIRNLVLACFIAGIALASIAATVVRITDSGSASPRVERGRWFNVTYPLTVRFEAGSDVREVSTWSYTGPLDPPEEFGVMSEPDVGAMRVDGRSGRILQERYNALVAAQSAFIEALRRGLRYEPFNPGSAPWPYADRLPLLGEAIADPEPLSGIRVLGVSDTPGGSATRYENWRSFVVVWQDPARGGAGYYCDVHEADRRAFARLVAQYVPEGGRAQRVDWSAETAGCRLTP